MFMSLLPIVFACIIPFQRRHERPTDIKRGDDVYVLKDKRYDHYTLGYWDPETYKESIHDLSIVVIRSPSG